MFLRLIKRFWVRIFKISYKLSIKTIISLGDDERKKQISGLVDSRKLLHILMNEEELKQKPLLVIINVYNRKILKIISKIRIGVILKKMRIW